MTVTTLYQRYRAEARAWIDLARTATDLYWRGEYIRRAVWCRKMARIAKR